MASVKKKSHRKNTRFPGLIPALFMLMITGLILSISLLIPAPVSVNKNAKPLFENFSRPSATSQEIDPKFKACRLELKSIPMLAIVIDDMGYDMKIDKAMINIEAPLSFAFLPYAPHTAVLSGLALKKGKNVLVHLPLETLNKRIDSGPGTLSLNMDKDETLRRLKKNLRQVQGATGVNNHMGSAYTADREHMRWILDELKRKSLFFLDSRTTKFTVAYDTAMEIGLASTWRDVFLDHKTDKASIKKELARAVNVALTNGSAVAIGHPYHMTLNVLYQELPVIRKSVQIVPVHRLLCRERK